ncbi:MAG: excinuclease ABC subunit UvrA [Mariniblastus sp.]|nr:excinuclease ABC subunit UvrA [Mariniblastus sp.]
MSDRQIKLRGVRVHNLQDVDLDIPHGQLLALCGLSGSGKSSLAFDTLYAEGQRRYIESLSPYTRQFLEQLEKPDADRIDGIPPAIAIRAARGTAGPRATVGSSTELIEYFRLLYAKIGKVKCIACQSWVTRDDPQSVSEFFDTLPEGCRFQIGFAITIDRNEPGETEFLLDGFRRNGFSRVVIENVTYDLAAMTGLPKPVPVEAASCAVHSFVIVDRLTAGSVDPGRVRESLETAFQFGGGGCVVIIQSKSAESGPSPGGQITLDGRPWELKRFSKKLICDQCQAVYPEPQPNLFSYNNALGACPECEGFGSVQRFDIDLIVPDPSKTIREGAIAAWNSPSYRHELEELLELAEDYHLPVDVPFGKLTPAQVDLIWQGVPERDFGGLNGFFAWLEKRKYKMHLRVFLSRWRTYDPCPSCNQDRLRPEVLAYQVQGKNLAETSREKICDLRTRMDLFEMDSDEQVVAGRVLKQIRVRLKYLCEVGLGYLALDRPLRTLSGGETQRVSLTSSLGSQLVNMLYVLDEPSAGLHPADVQPLMTAVQSLNQRGNTVVVVDHEPHMIASAQRVIEIGPEAGISGGEVVFDGTVKQMLRSAKSVTGQYMAGKRGLLGEDVQRRRARGVLRLVGARGNNLDQLDVEFPLGCLCVVTGVSGAGKSTLVQKTLYGAVCKRKGKTAPRPLEYDDVFGDSQFDEIVLVDQSPVGRSPRSNPVTYVKAFDEIRKAFAETMDAKTRNFKAGHFSFNVDGGRCNKCQGDGVLSIDMQFMADIYVKCDQCRGTRYRDEILKVRYRGKNIHEVLNLTVRQAFTFFRGQPKVQAKLKALIDVGLDYIRLGQPATTLSSGEAQRLKLAHYLNSSKKRRTLFLLDEPTSGLHMRDVVRLIDCFDALLSVGHSLIVIEHNLQLLKHADWVIDLGPGAADLGGKIVVQGTPEEVSQCETSVTGRYLKSELESRVSQ